MPACFNSFKNCVFIIDCAEIYIERPINLNARAQTFPSYKSYNSIKYLIRITPAGAVSFLWAGWGGRASGKEITLESGFLDKLTHGDCVLADHGFLVEEKLATRGAVLRIPAFTRRKKQTTAKDIDISRQIGQNSCRAFYWSPKKVQNFKHHNSYYPSSVLCPIAQTPPM